VADTDLNQEIHDHFHLFWDNFPFPVLLIRKDRTILDRNRAAEAAGCVPGSRCIDSGPKEAHKGCLAAAALHDQITQRKVQYVAFRGMVMDSYWIPLPSHDDVYVHFGIDITAYAADRFFADAPAPS